MLCGYIKRLEMLHFMSHFLPVQLTKCLEIILGNFSCCVAISRVWKCFIFRSLFLPVHLTKYLEILHFHVTFLAVWPYQGFGNSSFSGDFSCCVAISRVWKCFIFRSLFLLCGPYHEFKTFCFQVSFLDV